MNASTYWSLHTHTRESAVDALPSVSRTVARAKELGYPALAITDHGTVSGAVEHYLECRKAGIEPLIGFEAYLVYDRGLRNPETNAFHARNSMHCCIVAYTETGWRNLSRLVTMTSENFYYKPLLDFGDLAELAAEGRLEGLLITSGCWFGWMASLMRSGSLRSVANVATALQRWFDGMLFVEIQNHAICEEDQNDEEHTRLLHTMAVGYGWHTVLAQDSHYLYQTDQRIHDSFKTLVSWSDNPDDAIFPGDGYHMVDSQWMREHHDPDIYTRGMAGLDLILSKANLRIPELEEYHLRTPDTTVSGNADAELAELVQNTLSEFIETKRVPKSKANAYWTRLLEELDVISSSGFAGYLMLVRTVCDFMASHDIVFRVRGSATGSLTCWLLGITGYDPIRWGLSFDRFLSRDRSKPPDIDLDVEHLRRHEVVDMLRGRFYTAGISTQSQFGISEDTEGTSKGSLIVAYKMRARKIGDNPNAIISNEWMHALGEIAYYNGRRKDGTAIDSPIKSVGQHPAGMLIAPDAETFHSVPLRYVASSGVFVTAFTQDWVEKLGLVKLDVLGLRTLTALRIAEEIAGVKAEDFPLTDRKVFTRISSGDTDGMFQLEGGTARWGVKRMKPSRIADVIAAMALFRPAARASGATQSYLNRRVGLENVPDRHPLITTHTADTYGVLVYQEQALNILKDLGMSVEDIERARKAIKASNANVGNAAATLEDLMSTIRTLASAKGLSDEDVQWLSDAMHAYAGYSFNLAHATAYGILAYQTAYMAVHHPVAFWTGTLVANYDAPAPYPDAPRPEDIYLRAARAAGIRVRNPHVNRSEMTYCTDGTAIYKGLTSIPGIGPKVAQMIYDHAPFASLDDFARRVPGRVSGSKDLAKGHSPEACAGAVKALHDAHALAGLGREEVPSGTG